MNVWSVLGIAATRDVRAIKRAYAVRLKTINQRTQPEAFQRLRDAYEQALATAERAAVSAPATSHDAPADAGSINPTFANRIAVNYQLSTEVKTQAAPASEVSATDRQDEPARRVERDWNRAGELVRSLGQALREGGEPKAIERFGKLLAHEDLQSIGLRDAFEWQLIFALARTKPMPVALVGEIATRFAWHERKDLERSSAGVALNELLQAHLAHMKYEELRKLATIGYWSGMRSGKLGMRKAAQSLLAPYAPSRLRWRAMSEPLLAAVRLLLADIYTHTPALPAMFLDARTVAFWQRAAEYPPPSFRVLAVALIIGLAIAALGTSNLYGGVAAAVFFTILVGSLFACYGLVRGYQYWIRSWRSRYRVWAASSLDRTVGRVVPGAVQGGLRWKHFAIAVLAAFPIGIALTQQTLFPAIEVALGGFYLTVLVGIAALVMFGLVVLHFQTKYFLIRRGLLRSDGWLARIRRYWLLIVLVLIVLPAGGTAALPTIVLVGLAYAYSASRAK